MLPILSIVKSHGYKIFIKQAKGMSGKLINRNILICVYLRLIIKIQFFMSSQELGL